MIARRLKGLAAYAAAVVVSLACVYGLGLLPGALKLAWADGSRGRVQPRPANKVVLYGIDWCRYCAQTRAYLQQNNIRFTDLDIDKSPKAKKEHARLGGNGVPLIVIGDRHIHGFNASEIDVAMENLDN